MKKLSALVLALVMALSLISLPALAEGKELTVWCWDPAFNLYAMKEAEKVYQETHPDFKLNIVETPWPDIQTKLITAGMAGDVSILPDIFLCQDNAFQKNVISYPDLFVDLTDSGIPFADFGAAKVAYSVIEGKNYGVPFDNGAVINALRTDILEQAGYKLADLNDITWDRYIEIGKDVLAKTGKPLNSIDVASGDLIMMILQSAGASLFTEDGKPNIADNPVLLKAVDVYTTLKKEGVLATVTGWDEYISSFINGTVAGTINGCWIMGSIQTAKDQAGKWGVVNLPRLDGVEGATNYSNNGGSSWAISKNSKNPELAIDFLKNTFAGSVKFYETILPAAGALATYLPAGTSAVYATPQEFFGGQKVFEDITAYAAKIPKNNTGVYYYEAAEAIANALMAVVGGMDPVQALKDAQQKVEFDQGT